MEKKPLFVSKHHKFYQVVKFFLCPHVDNLSRVLLGESVFKPMTKITHFHSIKLPPVIFPDVFIPGLKLIEGCLEHFHCTLLGHIQGNFRASVRAWNRECNYFNFQMDWFGKGMKKKLYKARSFANPPWKPLVWFIEEKTKCLFFTIFMSS